MPDADHTGWTNGTTYVAGYSIVDANETQAGVDVRVAGAKDLAGNLQVVSDSTDLFSIDMQNPVLVSLTPNRMMIAESNVGRATFSLAMVYDEEMNTETTPTLTFPDEKVSSTLTLNASESGWSSNRAYLARYDVADANSTMAGVSVRVSAANDIAGNAQVQSEMPPLFSIDTQCPTDLDLSPSSIAENAETRTGDVELGKLLAQTATRRTHTHIPLSRTKIIRTTRVSSSRATNCLSEKTLCWTSRLERATWFSCE